MDSALASYIGHLAYGLILLSFMVRSMLWLRILAIFASSCVMIYAHNVGAWVSLYWNIAFLTVNLVQIGLLVWQKRRVQLSKEEKCLHQGVLTSFSCPDLKSFLHLGNSFYKKPGDYLVRQDTNLTDLYLLKEGKVGVLVNDCQIAELGPGSFIGEMSYLTGDKTRASVICKETCYFESWSHTKLNRWLGRNPDRPAMLQAALGRQLITELMHKSIVTNTTEHRAA